MKMELLTKELLRTIPPLHSQEDVDDATVVCKFFTPDAHWTWYVIEYDGRELFYGYVVGDYAELGFFALSELRRVRGLLGMPVLRDRYFTPRPLSEVMRQRA